MMPRKSCLPGVSSPVVLTTTILLIMICLPLAAAGGEGASGEPGTDFLSYLIVNQLLYDITSGDSTSPAVTVVENWIQLIGAKIGVVIRYTERIHTNLVRRANYLKRQMKILTGGAPRRRYFQKQWELQLLREEIASPSDRTNSLEKELEEAREKAQHLEEKVQQLEASGCSGSTSSLEKARRKRRSKELEDYSVVHQFRLKRQRKNECADSLKWMEQEGYTPLQLEIRNNRTGKLETVVLQEEDVDSMFGPDAASATDSDLDITLTSGGPEVTSFTSRALKKM